MRRIILFLLFLVFLSSPLVAEHPLNPCDILTDWEKRLSEKYGEVLLGKMRSANTIVHIYGNPKTQTWTLGNVIMAPDGPILLCVVSVGMGYRFLENLETEILGRDA